MEFILENLEICLLLLSSLVIQVISLFTGKKNNTIENLKLKNQKRLKRLIKKSNNLESKYKIVNEEINNIKKEETK